jgi:hypothetical protein
MCCGVALAACDGDPAAIIGSPRQGAAASAAGAGSMAPTSDASQPSSSALPSAADMSAPAADPGVASAGDAAEGEAKLPPFSFFVTSLRAMQELSGSADGFGGGLRFGETGPQAGLRGADEICNTIAEGSRQGSDGNRDVAWRCVAGVGLATRDYISVSYLCQIDSIWIT